MDVELLYKFIHRVDYSVTEDSFTASDDWQDHIPSVRVALNFSMFNHLSAFIALSGDVMVSSWNSKAFTYWDHGRSFGSPDGSFTVYPAFSAGIKF